MPQRSWKARTKRSTGQASDIKRRQTKDIENTYAALQECSTVAVYLVNNTRLLGKLEGLDDSCILLRSKTGHILIYKTSLLSLRAYTDVYVYPRETPQFKISGDSVENAFLPSLLGKEVAIYSISSDVMLFGQLIAFNETCLLIEHSRGLEIFLKQAISSIHGFRNDDKKKIPSPSDEPAYLAMHQAIVNEEVA